jgi:chromosome segregation ATPase
MLLFRRNNFLARVRTPHYINSLIFCIAGGSYLLISNVDHLQPPREELVNVKAEFGINLLFLTATVSIITLLHYLFLKRFNHLDPMMMLGIAALGKALSGISRSAQQSPDAADNGKGLAELMKQKEMLEQELMRRSKELEQLGVKLTQKKEKVKILKSSQYETKERPISYQEEEIIVKRPGERKGEEREKGGSISIASSKKSEVDIQPADQKFEEVEFVISPHAKDELEVLRLEFGELQEKYLKETRELKIQEANLRDQLNDLRSKLKEALEQKARSEGTLAGMTEEVELHRLEAERKHEEEDRISRLLETLRTQVVERDYRNEELERTCDAQDQNIKNLSAKVNELYTSSISLRQELDDTKKERDDIRREKMLKEDELLIVNNQYALIRREMIDIQSRLRSDAEKESLSFRNAVSEAEFETVQIERDSLLERLNSLNEMIRKQRENFNETTAKLNELEMTKEEMSLKLNQVTENYERTKEMLKDARIQLENLREVQEDKIQLEGRMNEYLNIIDRTRQNLRELQAGNAELIHVKEERDRLEGKLQELENALDKNRVLNKDLQSQITELTYHKEEKLHLMTKVQELQTALDKNRDLNKELQSHIAGLSNDKEEKLHLELKIQELENILDKNRELNKELQSQLAELTQDKEEKLHLQLKVQELENALDKNRVLNKELQGSVTELTQEKEENFNLQLRIQELENGLDKYKNLNKDLQSQMTELYNEKEEKLDLQQKVQDLESSIDKYRALIKDLQASSSELSYEKEDKLNLQHKIQDLESALESSRQLIKDLQSQSGDSVSLEIANSELSRRVAELESVLSKNKQVIKDLQFKVSEYSTIKDENNDLKDDITHLRESHERTRQLNKEFRDQLAKYERNQEQFDTILAENARLSSLNERLKSENDNFKLKFSKDFEDWDEVKAALELENHKLRKEVEQLKYRLQNTTDDLEAELNTAQQELESLKDQLEVTKNHYEIAHRDLERANQMTQGLKQELKERESKISEISQGEVLRSSSQERISKILEKQIEDLHLNLRQAEVRLENTVKEKEELRNELNKKQQELNTVSEECMELHKEIFEIKDKRVFSPIRSSRESSSMRSENSERSVRNIQDQIIIESMNEIDMNRNPLIRNVSKLKREPPMTYSNVWKLFENLMQEKCKLDRLEIGLGRQPRTMTEFMLDFVYLHYGLKTLALKQLKALIASLEELYKMGHPYGVLFCRFLGLFHPRPLPDHLSVYLLIVQEQFNFLISKVKSKKSSSYAQHYEILQFGGEAGIIDVMELVMKICKSRREAGERIISALHRESEDRLEVTMIKVCGTMARMGMNADYIFERLDMDGGGTIDYHEFVDGIRFSLNIWVTEEEVEDLCSFIDEETTGFVTKEEWNRKVNFVEYADKIYSKIAMVTKADFLSTLVDEYENQIIQDYYNLRQMMKIPVLNQSAFHSTLSQLDPTIEEGDIFRLWEEARSHDRETTTGVSAEALCVVVLKNRVGGYGTGMFDINLLDASLPKSSTEGVRTELVVERSSAGRLEVSLQRKSS